MPNSAELPPSNYPLLHTTLFDWISVLTKSSDNLKMQGEYGGYSWTSQSSCSNLISTKSTKRWKGGSDIVLMLRCDTFPVDQFWLCFMNCCILIGFIGKNTCLNSISDFVERAMPFQSHQIHSIIFYRLTFGVVNGFIFFSLSLSTSFYSTLL